MTLSLQTQLNNEIARAKAAEAALATRTTKLEGDVRALSLLLSGSPPAPPPWTPGTYHSTATQPFVRADGTAVRMTGMNLQPVFTANTNSTWSAATYTQIAAKGFNSLRMVLFWEMFEPSRGVWNETAFATLAIAVSRAKAAGLNIILDPLHTLPGQHMPAWAVTGDTVQTVQTNGSGYIAEVARRYKNETAVIAYDLNNEPERYPNDGPAVLSMYQTLINAARAQDPNKIVIIESTNGACSWTGVSFANLTTRTNVVLAFHDYFHGGSATGFYGDDTPNPNPQAFNYDNNATTQAAHLAVWKANSDAIGLPVWIGEFGIQDGATNHDAWINTVVPIYRSYGWSYNWWEYWSQDNTGNSWAATDASYNWKSWAGLVT